MSSELFQKLLLVGADDSRWSRNFDIQDMQKMIDAATPEQINYMPTEGKHKGKSVLWLVAKDCNFANDKHCRVFEHLLNRSNVDAINAKAKNYWFGNYELEPERSVLSLVAQTTSASVYQQFKLIAKLLEKGANIAADSESVLFDAICSSYEEGISLRLRYVKPSGAGLKERIAAIKDVRDDHGFILEHLSKMCHMFVIR